MGIDVSKQTFDVCFKEKGKLFHKVFNNDLTGFKSLSGHLSKGDMVLMEASGPYYVRLAGYLYGHGIRVGVVNPLKIKRYAQMRFYRAKTDRKDAETIMEYGHLNQKDLPLWQPEAKAVQSMKQMRSALELLQKQLHQSRRQLEAFSTTGFIDITVKESLESIIESLGKQMAVVGQRMLSVCKEHYPGSYEALTSIPGIGPKTAIMLIAVTDDFKKFAHHKQLIAYVGLSPRVYRSGTSVKGRGHICKMGKPQIRKLLYMCSWTAKKRNTMCKRMYDRLKQKGKPERVIKIAIANKLLKQAFAIATSKQKYIENHQPDICF